MTYHSFWSLPQVLPDEITLAKEPPLAPVHLTVIPLNVSFYFQPTIASWCLSPPLSVMLQHMCVQRSNRAQVAAISTTQRFRSKYVTIIIYKPQLPATGRRDMKLCGVGQCRDAAVGRASHQRGQQLASQHSRVSWCDGPNAQHMDGLDGLNNSQHEEREHMLLPSLAQTQSQLMGTPYAFERPEMRPESMDLGSNPSSQAALMDTSADWHMSYDTASS